MKDRLLAHLRALVGERHPITSPHALSEVEAYLTAQFRQFGCVPAAHDFPAFGGVYRNVIATLPSQTQALPLIIAAHYDTVERSPGADDNASGLAVLLETARTICRAPRRRAIRFIAFSLEEEDLLGSRAYAAALRADGEEILGAIVLECVGYARSEPGSQHTPPGIPVAVPSTGDFLAIVGNEGSMGLIQAIEESAKRAVAALKTISLAVPGKGDMLPDTRRSDHAAFWDHGFPAVMLTDTANFRNPHYHRPSDTIETLNLDFLSDVAAAVTAAVIELGGRPKS